MLYDYDRMLTESKDQMSLCSVSSSKGETKVEAHEWSHKQVRLFGWARIGSKIREMTFLWTSSAIGNILTDKLEK